MAIEKIDAELCVGCGVCVNSCSMDVIRTDNFLIEKEEIPACRAACPAGVNIRGYVYLLKQGNIEEAMKLIREVLPLPAVTGHVCFHPCESKCARNEVDEALNINALERYVSDQYLEFQPKPVRRSKKTKVAVVGSGPAGIAAAYDLTRMGYPVTVFESHSEFGGMLRSGIPEFRLPRTILDAQLKYIQYLGVEFIPNTTIGKDLSLDDLHKRGYASIFLAMGAQLSSRVNIEGINLNGVFWGLDFLRAVNLKIISGVKKHVVVIGGGNVAIDVALTALRLGAKEVDLVCLEGKNEMPAYQEEIQQALDEGIKIHTGFGVTCILGEKDQLTGVQLIACSSVFDKHGQFNPVFNEKITQYLPADMVIFAIGQTPDRSIFPKNIRSTARGTIEADTVTLETNLPGVFAGGDAVSGPASVVEAIAAGKRAAVSIHRYLKGENLRKGREIERTKVKNPPQEGVEKRDRQAVPLLPLRQRKNNFKEIKLKFSDEAAMAEAQRCMACGSKAFIKYHDDCMTCYACEFDCPEKAIYVSPVSIPPTLFTWG